MSESTERSPPSTERNLRRANELLDEATTALELDENVATTAELLYNELLDAQSEYLYWSINEAVAACVYLSTRMENSGYTPNEIATQFDIDTGILLRRAKSVINNLSGLPQLSMNDLISPTEYVTRYCEQLDVDDTTKELAQDIVEMSSDEGLLSGRSPTGVAAAAVYTAALQTDEKITQSEIATVADVSEVTIRNRYQEQEEAFF